MQFTHLRDLIGKEVMVVKNIDNYSLAVGQTGIIKSISGLDYPTEHILKIEFNKQIYSFDLYSLDYMNLGTTITKLKLVNMETKTLCYGMN